MTKRFTLPVLTTAIATCLSLCQSFALCQDVPSGGQANIAPGQVVEFLDPLKKLSFGKGDFSITLRATGEGELVSKYDPAARRGFHLGIITRQGVTHSQANIRQLTFGIDDGSAPTAWVDRGRLGNAIYVHALAVHDGQLFAGTCEPGKGEAGHVYRWDREKTWIDCGSPSPCNAVISLAAYRNKLYAGVGKYRVGGSALPESENMNIGGKIYRYDGDNHWAEVGTLPGAEAVGGLLVANDRLYASSLYRPAGFFRMESEGTWTSLPLPDGDKRVESMTVFDEQIFATSYDNGHVYRFDQSKWTDTGVVGDNTQTYGFAIYAGHSTEGKLYVSTWPSGRVFRYDGDQHWADAGRLGEELEVMGMASYNGQLYAGTLPMAGVYRYDGGTNWSSTGRLDPTPDVKYRRAWSMAVFQGMLFCGTLPAGHVYSMQAGKCVTYDHPLSEEEHAIAAVRQGGELRLYVDGKEVARTISSDKSARDVTSDTPLLIGKGPTGTGNASITNMKIHPHALSEEEIRNIASQTTSPRTK